MPWIPHVMVLDDDPRVLESLLPGFAYELAKGVSQSPAIRGLLRRGEPGNAPAGANIHVKVSTHGYKSDRIASYQYRTPFHIHLHLVRETGGRFDMARKLLNDQCFAVAVSDQRFSDDAGGQRAGQFFVEEMSRTHPEVQGILYSAYPRPDAFPADRFVRKGAEAQGTSLANPIIRALETAIRDPAVAAFAAAVGDQQLIYQSDEFGSVLAYLFDMSRLLGTFPTSAAGAGGNPPARARRALSCLLLDGESGTGKRGLAEVFHAASERRKAPMQVASCGVLSNETLLRSTLFGHKRGAFTDAREERTGLVAAAGKGVLLMDDLHRLPAACSAILHSFLEDGEYSRLGEEEQRKIAECALIITVETAPWRDRRRAGDLPPAFLARVERLALRIPPLRERPEDIIAQARWLTRAIGAEIGADIELNDDALQHLRDCAFAESNSRELRNILEQACYRHHRETDSLSWSHLVPFLADNHTPPPKTKPITPPATPIPTPPTPTATPAPAPAALPQPFPNEWQRRLRALAVKTLAKGMKISPEEAEGPIQTLFDQNLPAVWQTLEKARTPESLPKPIPLPVWEDIWRCFAVSLLGGPSPSERPLGIPANTLRQWINDRESR